MASVNKNPTSDLAKLILPSTTRGKNRLPPEIWRKIVSHSYPYHRIIDVTKRYDPIVWVCHKDEEGKDGDGPDSFDVAYEERHDGIPPTEYFPARGNFTDKMHVLSWQLRNDSLYFLYSQNYFVLDLDFDKIRAFEQKLRKNRQRIRYLFILANSSWGGKYHIDSKTCETLFASILPHLKACRIVAAQPHKDQGNAEMRDDVKLEDWVKWLKPYLKCFARHLSFETTLEVDVHDKEEATLLFNEAFPNGFRAVRCRHFGAKLFKKESAPEHIQQALAGLGQMNYEEGW
ncbi:hypothetical protein FQN55_002439 [Onygenales sp. PD_40]|nr:hypothetical protein FQN55_002439 [Onygenales sp. PD_40]KAK2783890.1 hypothetical protein FQN52_009409 [Onygenales sp. PD_12]